MGLDSQPSVVSLWHQWTLPLGLGSPSRVVCGEKEEPESGRQGCCLWVNTLGGLSFTEKFRGLGELPARVSKVGASQVALVVKNPPAKAANVKDADLILCRKDPLE